MNSQKLRIAMLGMIPGNGHPYSWSAIINGYNSEKMEACPYPVIPRYLAAQTSEEIAKMRAEVTHIWTDDPKEAVLVAEAAKIPHVADTPEAVIGKVDLAIVATDDGSDHVRRARPFIEAGIPVFIDKPLATTREELRQFIAWKKAGAKILSSSGLRYAPELSQIENKDWLWLNSSTAKTWERYGIHALEPLFKVCGPGVTHVRNESKPDSSIVYCRHRNGTQLTVAAIEKAVGSFGIINAYGKDGYAHFKMGDTYNTFRNQLLAVIEWGITGADPYPFEHTIELMAILIAGIDSRSQDGALISVKSVLESVN